MEKHSVTAKWLGKFAFEGNVSGHNIITDVSKESGGDDSGCRPKQLMLMSLAGCTGYDLAMIIGKMKLEVVDFRIIVEGTLTEDHPRYYESMHVVYEFTGKDLPLEKLQRAVTLSEDKYCGVMAVYKKVIKMSSEIRIIEK
jgi:putative redox protein